jgi:hypothetical protein
MEMKINDIAQMKKPHPCGSNRMRILRVGADLKLKCEGCGHELMTPRFKIVKKIKRIIEE